MKSKKKIRYDLFFEEKHFCSLGVDVHAFCCPSHRFSKERMSLYFVLLYNSYGLFF